MHLEIPYRRSFDYCYVVYTTTVEVATSRGLA